MQATFSEILNDPDTIAAGVTVVNFLAKAFVGLGLAIAGAYKLMELAAEGLKQFPDVFAGEGGAGGDRDRADLAEHGTLDVALDGQIARCEDFATNEEPRTDDERHARNCRTSSTGRPELQRCLREGSPKLPAIVITAHGDVAAARQAFLADAVDFIEKPFDGDQLLRAIDQALAGVQAATDAKPSTPGRAAHDVLSARERDVMRLMIKGLHNRRIAEELGISHRTVEVHKARVMEKLGVSNVIELVRLVDEGRG